jgi:GNAT superfamily N-acetyltransferase
MRRSSLKAHRRLLRDTIYEPRDPGSIVAMPTIRPAIEADLPAVVRLLSIEDEGIKKYEDPSEPVDPRYAEALATITADPNNAVLVAEVEGLVVGSFQLTVVQQLSRRGGRVAQIESVIVDPRVRSRGIGSAMMRWAFDEAKRQGCFRVQLTTNKVRKRAHAFYERLGFVASHEGMKRTL